MKKYTLATLMLAVALSGFAKQKSDHKRWETGNINLGYVSTSFTQGDSPKQKSNYGVSFNVGRTFYVHKKPIANMLRFGIDATWFDLTYTNYDYKHAPFTEFDEAKKSQTHELEAGMQIGPSFTINPVSRLTVHGYFRFAPSFTGFYTDDDAFDDHDKFHGAYAPYWVTGGSVSYGTIGVGIEARFGNAKMESVLIPPTKDDNSTKKETLKNSGLRIYLKFNL